MPIQTIFDNTYFVFDSGTTALSWPLRPRIQQVRIIAYATNAAVQFNVFAGTPIFRWQYNTVSAGSTAAVAEAYFTFPMGGVTYPTAWIPTTLTAASAWIDFC